MDTGLQWREPTECNYISKYVAFWKANILVKRYNMGTDFLEIFNQSLGVREIKDILKSLKLEMTNSVWINKQIGKENTGKLIGPSFTLRC